MVFTAWLSNLLTDVLGVRSVRKLVYYTYGLTKICRYSLHPGVSDKFLVRFARGFIRSAIDSESEDHLDAYNNLYFAAYRRPILPSICNTVRLRDIGGKFIVRKPDKHYVAAPPLCICNAATGYYTDIRHEYLSIFYLFVNYNLTTETQLFVTGNTSCDAHQHTRETFNVLDELLYRLAMCDLVDDKLYIDSRVRRTHKFLKKCILEIDKNKQWVDYEDGDKAYEDEDNAYLDPDIYYDFAVELCFQ